MSNPSDPFIRFQPIYQTRVWGGRLLETRFGRALPDSQQPYGESWEISARPEADSKVIGGAYDGRTLSDLWSDPESRPAIFGDDAPAVESFPLLCKILDARDKLSVQVHPPAAVAAALGGEPKTEVWYIAEAEPGAVLYVGVKEGVDPAHFRQAIEAGEVERCIHRLPVEKGQYLFLPSGRLHAIGAGLLIFEIQQSSDTTYRVFDWNRTGLDGKPRTLHIEESLQCIDFGDTAPSLGVADGCVLVDCEHFRLERHQLAPGQSLDKIARGRFLIVTLISGEVGDGTTRFREGDFFLLPIGQGNALQAAAQTELLATTWGRGSGAE